MQKYILLIGGLEVSFTTTVCILKQFDKDPSFLDTLFVIVTVSISIRSK